MRKRMQIAYELTEKDFTDAFSAHRNRNALAKWFRRIAVYVLAAFLAMLLLGSIRTHNIKPLMPFFVLALLWIAIMTGLLTRWSARRQFLKQPGAHGPRTLLLDDSGAHWRWNGGSGDVEWRNYVRLVESENHFLFYTSPACFNILPKRSVSAEQISELRDFLKQSIQAVK
jgi:hypothetical protein